MTKRKPNHPSTILKHHYMVPLGLTVTQVSEALGVSRKTLSNIVNGHASITTDLALRLSKAFSTSAELWLSLQQAYTLWETARASSDWKRVAILKTQIAAA